MARPILFFALLGALAVAACAPADPLAPRAGASLILISIDTLRADHLGCYGYERETSPHLDRLAASSVLFEDVVAPANNTAPSHMTMFTGVLPPVHGTKHRAPTPPSPALPLLAERLADAGYATWGIADGGYVTEPFGFDRGFDRFHSELEPVERKVRRAEGWTRGAPERPTFLFFHTYQVHAPYAPDPAFDRFTDPAYDGPLQERVRRLRAAQASGAYAGDLAREMELFWDDRGAFDERDRRHLVDLYDGEILQTDAALGALLEHLDAEGWLDRAWLVVTSDHGEAFGEHGTFNHRQLHQEELAIPLLVRPPGGLAEGRRVAARVRLVDVTPTVLAALSLPIPDGLQGEPLLPLEGLEPRVGHATRTDADGAHALLAGPRKLITREGALAAVYDLAADPGEHEDLGPAPPVWTDDLLEQLARIGVESARLRERYGEPEADAVWDDATLQTLRALGYLGGGDDDDR